MAASLPPATAAQDIVPARSATATATWYAHYITVSRLGRGSNATRMDRIVLRSRTIVASPAYVPLTPRGGPGKTGHAGVPDPLPTDFEFPTQTGYGPGAVVICSASNELHNDGFDCCKQYNATWGFCPKFAGCYLPSQQTRCTDAKATTPLPSGAQQTSPAGDVGTSGAMITAGTSGDGGATGTDVSTSTPTGAAVTNAIGGAMVVAMGVLGVAML
ncbi:hypothetical protein V492_03101 [Pseudogymnoascus sp. VKM F-4246]|nr:hypothetical protein V492_03101 [Pseudogymnoascus sp. VKM F-4246]